MEAPQMKRAWNHWLGWIVVFVVLADWLTKFLVLNRVALYERVAVVDGWLYFVRLQNRGIAFGILNDAGSAWRTPILLAVAGLLVMMLIRIARTVADRRASRGFALVIGGAIGNLVDRAAHGGVTDFVLVSFFPYVFNVADAALVIGACILSIGLTGRREPSQPAGIVI